MSHLADRTIVITGAGSGFGKIVASRTAARGARVVAADVNEAAVRAVVADLKFQGYHAVAVRADVTSRADMRRVVEIGIETFGHIDVMVNNAGIMPLAFYADHAQAADAWDRCIDVNIKGVLNGITTVYDHMIERGRGHVVCLSSIYGNHAVEGSAVYTATKAAVNILADTLRLESQGKIKVTIVRPTGVMGTGLGAAVVNPNAIVGIVGNNVAAFGETAQRAQRGELTDAERDNDAMAYWTITPEELAEQIIYTIDQPWGINIAEITVRASGEQYQM